jgi:hypothetical protein
VSDHRRAGLRPIPSSRRWRARRRRTAWGLDRHVDEADRPSVERGEAPCEPSPERAASSHARPCSATTRGPWAVTVRRVDRGLDTRAPGGKPRFGEASEDGSDGTRTRDLRCDRCRWGRQFGLVSQIWPRLIGQKRVHPNRFGTQSGTHAAHQMRRRDDVVQRRARDPGAQGARLLRGEVAGRARAPGQAPRRWRVWTISASSSAGRLPSLRLVVDELARLMTRLGPARSGPLTGTPGSRRRRSRRASPPARRASGRR